MGYLKKISIILPCYNMEEYLNRSYQSLACQKDADNVEFIFVNDGSKDKTLEMLRDIESKDDRVIVIDQSNAGVSAARNRALEIAKGEYIYLLDPDDYLVEDAIEKIQIIIEKNKPDLIIPAYNIDCKNKITERKFKYNSGLYKKNDYFNIITAFPTAPQLFYRNDIIKRHNICFNTKIKCAEVYEFTINYIRFVNSIFVLNEPIFNYYMRYDSATHKPNYNNDLTVLAALESIYNNAGNLVRYGSFMVTNFQLLNSFTINKYAKFKSTKETIDTVRRVLKCAVTKRLIKEIAFTRHSSLKNRVLAIYWLIMPAQLGFKLLNKLFIK